MAMENRNFCNRRYIFIHASFSIVMLVFRGVVRPLGVLKGLKCQV